MALYKIIFLFLFLSPAVLFSQHYPLNAVDNLLEKGIKNILDQNYHEAERIFIKLNKEYPEIPLGNIYLAATKISQAYDYGEEYDKEYIEDKLNSANELSVKLIKANKNNIWNYYFLALSNGFMAYFYAIEDKYINAFKYGLDSYSNFEKCYGMDSTFYESLIAIGTYKYWRSEKTKSLSWLPFITDEREEGIKYLKTALKNFSYNQYLAVYSLIWIEINNKHPEEAIELAKSVLKKYPNCRFFKWALARAYTDTDKREAIAIYKDILESTSGLSSNHYNEVILKHKIAMLYHSLNENKRSLKLCNEILEISNLSNNVHDRLNGRLAKVEKLKQELSNN